MVGQIAPPTSFSRRGTVHASGLLKGMQPQDLDVTVTMRGGAAAVGDVLMFGFSLTVADAAITSVVVGNAASCWRNVTAPHAVGISDGHPIGVALAAIADDAEGAIRVYGVCPAFVIAAAGSILVGDALVPTTAMNFDLVRAATERKFALALAAATTPTTRELMTNVFVDGHGGFGSE